MNLKRVWAALWREPAEKVVEKVVEKPVPVGDGVQDVYVASSRKYELAREGYGAAYNMWAMMNCWPYGQQSKSPSPEKPKPPEWQGRVYLTCAQAFAELGDDADLQQTKALIHDGKAYLFGSLTEREMAPKPKVPKGRAK